jgi:FkbM family methyltransferase
MSTFLQNYTTKIIASQENDFDDNWDSHRFGCPDPESGEPLSKLPLVHSLLFAVGLKTIGAAKLAVNRAQANIEQAIRFVAPHISNLEWLFENLSDEQSRETLVEILAYRALGHRKIKLSLNSPEHLENLRLAESLVVGNKEISPGFMHFKLQEIDLNKIGYPICFFFSPVGVVIDFIEQQYRCQANGVVIECEEGDFAIDAGGCWGDTALYFAHKSGPSGKVYSFEFLEDNLRIFHKNLSLNKSLAKNIQIIQNPVWSKSGEDVAIAANGPGTRITHDGASDKNLLKFKTVSIDDLVTSGSIEKADFIKMDIEGAELNALKGAELTIRRFKPKLAITVYHSLKDFWEIPNWLNSLGLGYNFYVRHFTIHSEETVLFAKI